MATTFFFAQHVNFGFELRVRCDRTWLADHLTAFQICLGNTTKKNTNVIAGFAHFHRLLEHFHTGHGCGLVTLEANDLNRIANLDNTTINFAGSDRTTTHDREYVFHWHQEWFVFVTNWLWNVVVHRFDKIEDTLIFRRIFWIVISRTCTTTCDWNVVARELVLREKFAKFHFNELKKFFIVNKIDLVEEDHQSRNTHLAGQKNVFTSLWHRTVSC